MKGVNHHNMNEMNKYVILKMLSKNGAMSRIDLSTQTNLSKMAITAIVNGYIEQDVICECGKLISNVGRKPKLIEIKRDALLTLGVSIGRNIIQVGIVNTKGEVLQYELIPFDKITNSQMLLNNIFYLCDKLLESEYKNKIWGIGVSCAGPLSVKSGIILNPPNFNGIKDLAIVNELKSRYKLPCYLQNDMCVSALAESYFGNSNKYNSFLYVGISRGIGGGLILDNKLFTGSTGLAGNIGHSIVEMNGNTCECGQKGCLEKYASISAIVEWAKEYTKNKEITWSDIVNGIDQNLEVSLNAFDRMTGYLSVAITNFIAAFDIECVIVGGDLNAQKEYIVKGLNQKLNTSNLIWTRNRKVEVQASKFTNNATLIGLAALVLENNLDKMRYN